MATRLVIEGGSPLTGEVQASAAKNAALPAMAATLLTAQPVILENVPALADVVTMRKLLERLGAETTAESGGATRLQVARVSSHEAPYDLVSTMRASVLVLGPLLARAGVARVALPGGRRVAGEFRGNRVVVDRPAGAERLDDRPAQLGIKAQPLDDVCAVEHDDSVCLPRQIETMRDHDRAPPSHHVTQPEQPPR